MAKVRKLDHVWLIQCPGCQSDHPIDDRWKFNGDKDYPTFTPSLLVEYGLSRNILRCHSYIIGGKIQFLPDSTHKLAGKTVDLPEYLV